MAKVVDPVKVLEQFVAKYPTKGQAAKALRISQPHLTDLLRRRRNFTDLMLQRLGLQWIATKAS